MSTRNKHGSKKSGPVREEGRGSQVWGCSPKEECAVKSVVRSRHLSASTGGTVGGVKETCHTA